MPSCGHPGGVWAALGVTRGVPGVDFGVLVLGILFFPGPAHARNPLWGCGSSTGREGLTPGGGTSPSQIPGIPPRLQQRLADPNYPNYPLGKEPCSGSSHGRAPGCHCPLLQRKIPEESMEGKGLGRSPRVMGFSQTLGPGVGAPWSSTWTFPEGWGGGSSLGKASLENQEEPQE